MKRKKSKTVKVQCKHCGNIGATKYGDPTSQRYKCTSCGRTFRKSSIPKNQQYAIPVLLNILTNKTSTTIEDTITNRQFNQRTKSLIEKASQYKLVSAEITKDNSTDLRSRGNGLTLAYLDEHDKTIKNIKLEGIYNISCFVSSDGNITISLQK